MTKVKEIEKIEENLDVNITDAADTAMNGKGIELPENTIEKLLNNEFQISSVGTDDIIMPVVEPIVGEPIDDDEGTVENNEDVEYNEVDFKSRGFKTMEDAINFINTDVFKKLGDADKEEFKNWLIK